MVETLVEKNVAKERLEHYLATHKVKVAATAEELYTHSIKDDNGEEVDDFVRLLEEWRKEDKNAHREID